MKRIVYIFITLLCLSICMTTQVDAEDRAPTEYAVKAAFLYNFTKFVEWPEEALKGSDSLIICVFGENPFGNSLETTVEGNTAQSKPIKIIYSTDVSDIPNCHMLFITKRNKQHSDAVLMAVVDLPVLTVSDLPGFASDGGMIGFYFDNNRIRFEVNRQAANDLGLSFSSRLLKIARIVQEEE